MNTEPSHPHVSACKGLENVAHSAIANFNNDSLLNVSSDNHKFCENCLVFINDADLYTYQSCNIVISILYQFHLKYMFGSRSLSRSQTNQ